ncbi:hypothetical protein [Deinococcus sp.]|nr:hypothetical protein [Deinococcus sp.]
MDYEQDGQPLEGGVGLMALGEHNSERCIGYLMTLQVPHAES